MRKEIKRNLIITIFILFCFNFIFSYIYNNFFSVKTVYDSVGSGRLEAATMASRVDYFIPILIIVNISIIVISSISVSRYLIDFENFPAMSNFYSRFSKSLKKSKEIIDKRIDNNFLIQVIEKSLTRTQSFVSPKLELTAISDDLLKKIDNFRWKSQNEKFQFIKELIALTPKEREDILDYMLKKTVKDSLST